MSLWEMPGKLYTNQSSVLLWRPYLHANKQQPVLQQLSTKDRTRAQGKRLNIATQRMTGYIIRLYWPLPIDKLRIQFPETSTKKLFSLAQMRHAPYTRSR